MHDKLTTNYKYTLIYWFDSISRHTMWFQRRNNVTVSSDVETTFKRRYLVSCLCIRNVFIGNFNFIKDVFTKELSWIYELEISQSEQGRWNLWEGKRKNHTIQRDILGSFSTETFSLTLLGVVYEKHRIWTVNSELIRIFSFLNFDLVRFVLESGVVIKVNFKSIATSL